jgi:hypothetical protein
MLVILRWGISRLLVIPEDFERARVVVGGGG